MKSLLIALALTISAAHAEDMMKTTQLDDLVRGELSAVKAYDAALADLKPGAERTQLESIRKGHDRAVTKLTKYVAGRKDLLADTESAGAWGTFAKSWVKGAGLMGNTTALKALKQGEEHGIAEYEEALKDETISASLKKEITAELLPAQKAHINSLQKFMK